WKDGSVFSGSNPKIRKCSSDHATFPLETFQLQLPVWLILCPSAKNPSLLRSFASALLRSMISLCNSSLARESFAVRSSTLASSSLRAFRSSDSLSRRRFSARLRASLHELMTSAEKRNATVVGISRTLNSNAKNGSVKKKLIDKVESKTAKSPGPVPPNHVASSTAGKKREVRTPKLCSGNVTTMQIATNKTERPYRQTAGVSRRKPRFEFDILLTPKVYLRRSSP